MGNTGGKAHNNRRIELFGQRERRLGKLKAFLGIGRFEHHGF
jgi:hypothetical protein